MLSGRVVIRIHDEHGQLVAYAGRSVDGREPRYRSPAGFGKSQVLFNFHRARLAIGFGRRAEACLLIAAQNSPSVPSAIEQVCVDLSPVNPSVETA